MRGGVGVMIGLDLDNDTANAVDQQRCANQIGGDLMYAAGEELATEWFAQILFGRGAVLGHSAGMLVAKAEQGEPLRFSVHWLS